MVNGIRLTTFVAGGIQQGLQLGTIKFGLSLNIQAS